jgi:multidrug efflux pump subunit AcrB
LPIQNVKATVDTALLGYDRIIDFWGQSGSFALAVPYAWLSANGDVFDQAASVSRMGLGDLTMRLAVNLYGAPALSLKEFAGYQQDTIIGVSLLVSFSLTPMLCARWLKGPSDSEGGAHQKAVLERVVDVFYRPVERAYMAVLGWVMKRRWVVVVAAAATLGSCIPLAGAVPKGFTPDNDMAEFEVNVRAPEGTSLAATGLTGERIARQIRALPGIEHTVLTIGNNQQQTGNLANIYVRLVDPRQRAESQTVVMNRVRSEIVPKQPKDLRIEVSLSSLISTGQSNARIQYTVAGPELSRLAVYTNAMLERFRKVPGAVDVDSNLIIGNPEVRVTVDRDRAANLGVSIADIANTLQLLVGGLKVSTFQEGGEDYDIDARADRVFRSNPDALALMTVPTRTGGVIPLASVVSVKQTTGPSQINRLARQRQVTVTANTAPGYGESTVTDALKVIIADMHLAPGYRAVPAGLTRETGRIVTGFLVAIGMSAIFMYLILAAQFASWLHPITIMISLPLTIPFALLSLLLFHQELSIMSALGIIVLFGVVKKNSILQIDHMNALRAHGMDRAAAIMEEALTTTAKCE